MTHSTRPTALFLSPHLDDVAFSCGGTAAALGRLGRRVAVATVFAASVPHPSGFALACQLDKGLSADVDYMALRRDEDAAFGRALSLGVDDLLWLDFPEAPHRGYRSAPELFAGLLPGDDFAPAVASAISRLVDLLQPELVFAPQAVGGHADHRQVVRAVLAVPGLAGRTTWYRDLPYAERCPGSAADPSLPGDLMEVPVALEPADLAAKLAGCACYASQVPFQFGDADSMRRRLAGFASAEAARLGLPGHVETFLGRRQPPSHPQPPIVGL